MEVNPEPSLFGDEFAASNLYDTIFSKYFDEKPQNNRQNNRKVPKNKNSGHQSQSYKAKEPIKIEKIPEYIKYKKNPEYKVEYEKLVGRKGLGFDKRTATTYGMRAPITAKSLEVVGRKYYENKEKKDLIIF